MNSGDFLVFVKLQQGFVKLQRLIFSLTLASAYFCKVNLSLPAGGVDDIHLWHHLLRTV
jgi:hypothetical protein